MHRNKYIIKNSRWRHLCIQVAPNRIKCSSYAHDRSRLRLKLAYNFLNFPIDSKSIGRELITIIFEYKISADCPDIGICKTRDKLNESP